MVGLTCRSAASRAAQQHRPTKIKERRREISAVYCFKTNPNQPRLGATQTIPCAPATALCVTWPFITLRPPMSAGCNLHASANPFEGRAVVARQRAPQTRRHRRDGTARRTRRGDVSTDRRTRRSPGSNPRSGDAPGVDHAPAVTQDSRYCLQRAERLVSSRRTPPGLDTTALPRPRPVAPRRSRRPRRLRG